MYKDVWKKFGWKMLIAVCSVLLLGGVAFAAPRLQADEAKISLAEVKLTAKDVIYTVDMDKVHAHAEKIGKDMYPVSLAVTATGAEIGIPKTLSAKELKDYFNTSLVGNNISEVGKVTVRYEANPNNPWFQQNTSTEVSFNINPCKNPKIRAVVNDGAGLVLNGEPVTMTDAQLKVYVTLPGIGEEIELPKGEYSCAPDQTFNEKGSKLFAISYNNYIFDGEQQKKSEQVSVYKHVDQLKVYIDDDLLESYPGGSFEAGKKGVISVYDGDKDSSGTPVTDYMLIEKNIAEKKATISAKADNNAFYCGTRVINYNYTSKSWKLKVKNEDYIKVYNEDAEEPGKGYIYILDELENSADGTVVNRTSDYTIDESDFVINDGNGGTAGKVTFTVRGLDEYEGNVAHLTYYVYREITKDKVDIVSTPSFSEAVYTYEQDKTQKPELKITFKDDPEHELKVGSGMADYAIRYENRPQLSGAEPTNDAVNAGTITMFVEGNGSPEKGGYYGSLEVGQYKINPQSIDEKYHLRLREGMEDGAIYPYTGDYIDVSKDAILLVDSDNPQIKQMVYPLDKMKRGVDYWVEYFDEKGGKHSEGVKDIGKYKVKYTFVKNFDGVLEADFEIYSYDVDDCIIDVGKCAGEENGHIYNGQAHHPELTVTYEGQYGGKILSPDMYEVEWGENVNAGEGSVTITIAGKSKQRTFKIAPMDISKIVVAPKNGYTLSSESPGALYTHNYVGKTGYPELSGVFLSDGKNELNLAKDTDYTVGPLYDASGKMATPENALYPKTDTSYYFEITGRGNYTGIAETSKFKLEPKLISSKSIKCTIENGAAGDTDLNYVKRALGVYDEEFGDTLVWGRDYVVTAGAIKNGQKSGAGITVTIKGAGCYSGQTTVTYYAGTSIEDAIVFNDDNTEVTSSGGALWFDHPYEEDGKGGYKIDYKAKRGDGPYKVYLKLGGTELYMDTDYQVDYGPFKYVNDDTKKICSVTFKGIDEYYGEIIVYFEVARLVLDSNNYEVELEIPSGGAVYEARPICPSVRVHSKASPGAILSESDYKVEYGENIDAGNNAGEVIITGKRNYTGTITKRFEIKKRDITGAYNQGKLRLNGLAENKVYKYAEWTGSRKGVWPDFVVEFNIGGFLADNPTWTEQLRENTDYTYRAENNDKVWRQGTVDRDKPVIHIECTDSRNFEGTLDVYFEIAAADLATECELEILDKEMEFTGEAQTPRYTIKQNGKELTTDQYKAEWSNNVFVSGDVAYSSGAHAVLTITPSDKSNYSGSIQKEFIIKGNLNPQKGSLADSNSETILHAQPIDYPVKDDDTFVRELTFQQVGTEAAVQRKVDRYMQEGTDFTTVIPDTKVGNHKNRGTVAGKGYFKNSMPCDYVIRGDLSNDQYTSYTKDLGIITGVDSGSAIEYLVKKISPVICGEKTLQYGEDYVFNEPNPNMDVGTHTITIQPSTSGALYLVGSASFTYEVRYGFSDEFSIEGIPGSGKLEYNHGDPVLTGSDLRIQDTVHNKPLIEGEDYVIDSDASRLTKVGPGRLVLKGMGQYTGTVTKEFEIIKYNLANHYTKHDISVNYNGRPVYTGKTINADDLNIVIQTDDGKVINRDEYRIEFLLDSGDADYVNWTSDTSVTPQFKIVAKENNYTGEIDSGLKFKIQRKPITDEDVIFELLGSADAYVYHESETLLPEPEGTYNGSVLKKARYQTGERYEGLTYDYTYEYQTDVKSAGEKVIRITGVGNFIGSRQLTYTVEKKNIKDDNVVLTLTAEAPYIYNGQSQTPSFELTYDDQKILVYDGTKTITTKLSDPQITYGNEINAGTAVIHIIANPNDPNYTGQKDYTFTIEPLPIDNHISFLWGSERNNLASFKLELPRAKEWTEDGGPYLPKHLQSEGDELPADDNSYVRVYYNGGGTDLELFDNRDYTIDRYYVEPDTDDTRIREEYDNQDFINAGKVKVTITGTGNYTGTACYWYYIGTDISAEGASSLQKTTTVFNAQQQWPVEVVSGLDASKYRIVRYRHAVTEENILGEKPVKDKDGGDTKAFIDADTYYIRIEGKPEAGTYSSKPIQLTYTILPRSINRVLIDGYKAEYQYTGSAVCPAGLTVTDPIDEIRYKLTENKDYTISYSNNINAGVASIIIKGQGNYDSGTTATARFTITSSTISSGSSGGNGGGSSAGSSDGSSGQLAGPSSAISADDVRLTMDTSDAMYYTGSAVYPGVYISGMTENIDYTVTFSNNINVGQGIVTIRGINNSSGVITKTFRIIGDLAKCSVAAIPDQAYTGLAVTPGVTVTCGTNTLLQGTDYTLSYANNINIGTASVVITAARDSNYVGSVTVNFSIGNGISSAVVSGYASHYTYTGEPITPAVSVAAGSATLRAGTDYTVEYTDNTNAGTATMTITGKGVYSGTQKVTFVIEPKSIASCTTTDVSGKKYTGDAYTPAVTVSDGGKTLTNGVDYTVTYANNTNPGVASIIIRALNDNYTGTKTINFRIGTVAVSNFHAGNIKSTSMTLAWTAQDYASGYQICDANSRVVKNSTKNKVTLTGLTSGKTYKYKVRSFIRRADGTRAYGSFSTVISATTKLKTPAVKAASTGKNKARVRWSKVTGATGYQIYYSKSATKGFKKLKTTKNTVRTLNIKGLSSGQRYFFRVRAYKRVGSKNIYSNYNSLKAITVK